MKRSFKRILSVITITLILVLNILPVTNAAAATRHFFDNSGLMYQNEISYVNEYLTSVSDDLQFDVVGVLIYEGLEGDDLRAYADDFYDDGGFGYGDDHDGVILVVDMYSRQMMVVSTGYGIEAVTDYGEELIYDYLTESLKDQDYVTAFTAKYADMVKDLVEYARTDRPVDTNEPGDDSYDWYQEPEGNSAVPEASAVAGMGGVSLAIGAGAGLFSSQRQKSKLKSVRQKFQANSYERRGSLVLSRKQDRFLYRTVAVTHRPKNEDHRDHRPGRGGGGGTTIHMGSSGVPHGGGHGRSF